ncbi:MAG TPA: transcriptional regulator [Cyanobacteria bacterium UBA9971]|nr:transcriptional regulator [Cyanobacteria bacterium UBA9971]
MNKEEFIIKLGQKIKKEREKQGFSQQKMAEKSDMSMHYLGCIERAEQNITVAKLFDISNALGIDISELLKLE